MRKKIISMSAFLFFLIAALRLILSAPHPTVASVAKMIKPAVVTINTYDKNGNPLGQGSGFFVAKDQIISNRHVFEGACSASAKANSGEVYRIIGVVAQDEIWDIILVKCAVENEKIQPLIVTDKYPQEGQKVIIVGSPIGLEQSISDGIVSSVRNLTNFGKIIQITAPVYPGSSGSPVVNFKGEVIGVATLHMTEAASINFAVPAERILALTPFEPIPLALWGAETKDKLFRDDKLGYYIKYPVEWVYEKPSEYQVVFSGVKGTQAYYNMVSVQVFASSKRGGQFKDAAAFIEELKKQLRLKNAKIYDEKVFVYASERAKTLTGAQFLTEYKRHGKEYKQWHVIVPDKSEEVFYVWSYVSLINQYDTYLGRAKEMLSSWKITR